MMKKNILIIDDSALMRRVISDIIEADKRFRVIGAATNGLYGLTMLKENFNKVDVVLLDINMPRMNGIELLEELKKQDIKTTVIVVSSITTKDAKETIYALELGAFDFITKPESLDELKSSKFSKKLLDSLAMATKISLSETQGQRGLTGEETEAPIKIIQPVILPKEIYPGGKNSNEIGKLVAIACSTGGPKALHTIVPTLPKELDAGVVIVQHMPEGFTKSLAERLNSISQVPVKEAEDGDILKKGWVYIAKGGKQLRVVKGEQGNHLLRLSDEPARHGLVPSADVMYESLIDTDYNEITCVVLTGMGSDGSAGISKLSNKKNIHVIAQDSKTSVVYGMPKMIKKTGLVDEVVTLHEVADAIIKNVGVH